MNPNRAREEMEALAQRMIWWKSVEEALRYPNRLLAQVMVLGTWEDVELAKRSWPPEAFLQVLRQPPVGVFDARSWVYWHTIFKIVPAPPLPVRQLP